uniref:Metalloendopeptidase n=1 Tax=Schmidtea mediterranea TaxID=79327 RepID=A0A060Q6Y6_SCHMD|nr:Ast4 protein [Schmidtea mediterranea]
MTLKTIISFITLSVVIELCSAQCGCTQKGIKISNFNVGDMVLSSQDVLRINGFKAAQGVHWPNKLLRYTFDPSYPDKNKNAIREFLKIYEKELGNCLRFLEEKSDVYATVVLGGGCSANVGYNKNYPLSITLPDPCVNRRNVKHEFTHLLGFMHEHTRPDRDQFLKIEFGNVHSGLCNNFYLCEGCKLTTTYDFDSIMQYPSEAFSCNGKDTILKKNGGKIPFNMEVTKLDAKKVRDYYGC